jgi:hypothetical protein
MLIRPISVNPDRQKFIELEQFGIMKAHRQLMLFIDYDNYKIGNILPGKAILTNIAAQIGMDNDIIHRLGGSSNSSLIKSSTYYFDMCLSPLGLDDIKSAYFTLADAHSSEIMYDFDTKTIARPDTGIYNKNLSTSSNMTLKCEIFGMNQMTTFIPNPKYYTERHQRGSETDLFSLIWVDYLVSFDGNDIIDQFTSIDVYDIKTWGSMVPVIKATLDNMGKVSSSPTFASSLFPTVTESIIDAYAFAYDSENKDVLVKQIPGRKIPLTDYRIKENMLNDLNWMIDMIKIECKKIEKKHGSIRVHFAPCLHGDKIEVKFRDYNEAPFEYQKSSIDKSYTSHDLLSQMVPNALIGDDGEC